MEPICDSTELVIAEETAVNGPQEPPRLGRDAPLAAGIVAGAVLVFPVAVDRPPRVGTDPFAFARACPSPARWRSCPRRLPDQPRGVFARGYRSTDYIRVGTPLQLLLAALTPVAIGRSGPSEEQAADRPATPREPPGEL